MAEPPGVEAADVLIDRIADLLKVRRWLSAARREEIISIVRHRDKAIINATITLYKGESDGT